MITEINEPDLFTFTVNGEVKLYAFSAKELYDDIKKSTYSSDINFAYSTVMAAMKKGGSYQFSIGSDRYPTPACISSMFPNKRLRELITKAKNAGQNEYFRLAKAANIIPRGIKPPPQYK